MSVLFSDDMKAEVVKKRAHALLTHQPRLFAAFFLTSFFPTSNIKKLNRVEKTTSTRRRRQQACE